MTNAALRAFIRESAGRRCEYCRLHEGDADFLSFHIEHVVAKAGYGTVCEAMARGTPMIYPPRSGFAEYRSLDRVLRSWGGGVPISSRDFFTLKLDRALTRALEIGPGPAPYLTDGAKQIASHLASLCRPSRGRKVSVVAGRGCD